MSCLSGMALHGYLPGSAVLVKVITRPGDVITGGAGGMGPCHPPQHQLPGVEYTYNILCIFNLHTVYIK